MTPPSRGFGISSKRKPPAKAAPEETTAGASPGRDWLVGIVGFALLIRLLHWLEFRHDFWFLTPLIDDNFNNRWALAISAGDWLGRTLGPFVMNPGYPYALAAWYKILGSSLPLVAFWQHLAGAAACGLVAWVGARIWGAWPGRIAGILAALYAPSVFYEEKLLAPVWLIGFNLGAIALLLRTGGLEAAPTTATSYERSTDKTSGVTREVVRSTHRIIGAGLAGLCLGLSALCHPFVLVFAGLVLLWMLWPAGSDHGWKNRLRASAAYGLGLLLALAPATIRNAMVEPGTGLTLTTVSAGFNFYMGNNAEAQGTHAPPAFARFDPDEQHQDFRNEAGRRLGRPVSYGAASAFWMREALTWMRTYPENYRKLLKLKWDLFWNFVESPDNAPGFVMDRMMRLFGLPLVRWGLVAPLAVAGLVAGFRRDRNVVLLYLYLAAYLAASLGFFVLSRYRYPVAPALCLFAGVAVWRIVERLRTRRAGAGLLVIMAGISALAVNQVKFQEQAHMSHYSTGVILGNRGREAEAVQEYLESIRLNSNFLPARINLANLYLRLGRRNEAAEAYREIARRDPARADEVRRILTQIRVQ